MNSDLIVHDILAGCGYLCQDPVELLSAPQDARYQLAGTEFFSPSLDERVIPSSSYLPQSYFWLPSEILPVNVYKVIDLVYTHQAFLYKHGQPISGGNLCPPWAVSDAKKFDPTKNTDTVRIDEGFILLHSNYTTYGHFLLEMIPKIMCYFDLARHRPELKLILPSECPAFVREWLEFLAPRNLIFTFPLTTRLEIDTAYLSDMASTNYVCSTIMKSFIELCITTAKLFVLPQIAAKLFISRNQRRLSRRDFRNLENENQIREFLAQEGVKSLSPEYISIPEQISIFSSANLVIGELSSGLHNCIFSPAKTKIVQLNPFNPAQRRISAALHHDLVSILADDNGIHGWPGNCASNFSVNIDRIGQAIF